jgi:hypothetical protein
MTCRDLGKLESTVQTQVSKFASSVLAAYALFSSMALSAEMSPPSDTIPKSSDSTQTSVPRRLSDAQMEALMKEIGIPYHGSTETSPRPEATTPLLQSAVTPSDAQTQALLREMGHWYDSRMAVASRPQVKPAPPSRRTWHHQWRYYSARGGADGGEATRLMRIELQQRGMAAEPSPQSGNPQ